MRLIVTALIAFTFLGCDGYISSGTIATCQDNCKNNNGVAGIGDGEDVCYCANGAQFKIRAQ